MSIEDRLMADDMAKRIETWAKWSPGEFTVNELDRELEFDTFELRRDRTVACEKLVADGIFERIGKRRGVYRMRQNDLVRQDLSAVKGQCVDLWMPFNLTKGDRRLVNIYSGNIITIGGEKNSGKALANGTPVLTDDGWVSVENLRVGDRIFGRNGKAEYVQGVFPQGINECYRFTFNDGSVIESDESHIWAIQTYDQAYRQISHGKPNGDYGKWIHLTTKQIVDRYGMGRVTKVTPRMPKCEIVEFSKKEVSIDPYILGVLLGDGNLNNCTTRFSTKDEEIVNYFRECGYTVNHSGGCDYRILKIYKELELLGLRDKLSHQKFIPKNYLFNDIETRKNLLQGLMDTDGYVSEGGLNIEYCSVSRQLAEDVAFLVRSFGGRATIKTSSGYSYSNGGKKQCKDRHRVFVKINGVDLFKLSRKAGRQGKYVNKKTIDRQLRSIEYAGRQHTTCIKTSAKDGLFITKDFIVTHNTAFLLNIALSNRKDWNVHYFNSEMPDEELAVRTGLFDCAKADWDLVNFYFRHRDFADVVFNGKYDLNIIDFLEISDDFYLIGQLVRNIFDRLGQGVAIIAVQKKTGADNPRGGEFVKEKSRLHLDLSHCEGEYRNKMLINPAKNWAQDGVNPTGMYVKYKLAKGNFFKPFYGQKGEIWFRDE